MFVQGISFMDNLTGVSKGNKSYAEKYRDEKKESSIQDMIVRHTYALEDGYYIQREGAENIKGDPSTYLQNDQDIVETLKEKYSEIWILDEEKRQVSVDGPAAEGED
jgi:hypothetical protein